jgi:anti-anti-sigma factor
MNQPLGHLEIEWHNTTAIVVAHGEIDRSNADGLGDHIVSSTAQATELVVDLSTLGYLDSAALSMIHKLSESHPQLVLVAPAGSRARRLLEIAGMDTVTNIVETRTDALDEK